MELTYDWRGFQAFFARRRRHRASQDEQAVGPAYFIVSGGVVTAGFSEQEDLSEWVGAPSDEIFSRFGNRELAVFDQAEVDRWMRESVSRPHYFDQLEDWKARALPYLATGNHFNPGGGRRRSAAGVRAVLARPHFLLEALRSNFWKRVLPASYGVYIRVEGREAREFFVLIRRGELVTFHCPDPLDGLKSGGTAARAPNSLHGAVHGVSKGVPNAAAETTRQLSDKHAVPVQGIVVTEAEWQAWMEAPDPWRQALRALRSGRARLAPRRVGLVSLVAARAYLGI